LIFFVEPSCYLSKLSILPVDFLLGKTASWWNVSADEFIPSDIGASHNGVRVSVPRAEVGPTDEKKGITLEFITEKSDRIHAPT